jgi:DNA-directed RNA polymerase beta' subunit
MGHIELPSPVVHPWYLRGPAGNRLAEVLGMGEEELRAIAARLRCVSVESGRTLDVGGFDSPPGTCSGAEAFEVLQRRVRDTAQAGSLKLDLSGVVMRRLPVLPPDLRPAVLSQSGQVVSSDLNNLYGLVLDKAARVRQAKALGGSGAFLDLAQHNLQSAVDRVLDNGRSARPGVSADGRKLSALPDSLIKRAAAPVTGAALRDGLLTRPVDFSATTRTVVGETPEPGTVLIPTTLAWTLFKPMAIHALVTSGTSPNVASARNLVDTQHERAVSHIRRACEAALVLVAFPDAPWPLLAVRVSLSTDRALRVHPALLERIGWSNLGATVRIFGILTQEAHQEAAARLTLERLSADPVPPYDGSSSSGSFFDLAHADVLDEIADAALTGRSFPLAEQDGLLLCDPVWPAG